MADDQAIIDAQRSVLQGLFASSEVPNDPKTWDAAWSKGLTPWDNKQAQPALMELLNAEHDQHNTAESLDGQQVPISQVIPKGDGVALVPGCGRGYDVQVFAERGLNTFGVDISTTAVEAANTWLRDQNLEESLSSRIQFVEADFFSAATESSPAVLPVAGSVQLCYDYTFLCAIPPSLRKSWAETYTRLIKPGGILIALVYPIRGDRPGGPPFSISPNLVRQLLGDVAGSNGDPVWKELADLEPKRSNEHRAGIERVMVWRRL